MSLGRSGTWVPLAYLIVGVSWVAGSSLLLRGDTTLPSLLVDSMLLFVVLSALLILFLQRARDRLANRLRESTQQLAFAQAVGDQSDSVKTTFLTTMSHELRTPLNSILGFTDVILEGYSGPLTDAQTRQLEIVRESASHLRSLIEDVLDITRIEAGQVGLEFTAADMRAVVAEQMVAFETDAARKGLALQMRADDSVPLLRTDSRRAGQIVTNLLANAVKFTHHGSVTVTIATRAERLEISVTDTGIGIAPEDLASLFKPFSQVAQPGGRLQEGTGLGLAISRKLAHALGGDVTVESTAGGGSRFTLWLPLGRDVDTDPAPSNGATPCETT